MVRVLAFNDYFTTRTSGGAEKAAREVDARLIRDRCVDLMVVAATPRRAPTWETTGFAATGSRLVRGRQSWGHEELIGRFIDAVQGRGPVPVTSLEARTVVRTVADVIDSLGLVETSRR